MVQKYVIICIANLEQQLEKRATFILTSCNNSSEMKMCKVRVSFVSAWIGFGLTEFCWISFCLFLAEVLNN